MLSTDVLIEAIFQSDERRTGRSIHGRIHSGLRSNTSATRLTDVSELR